MAPKTQIVKEVLPNGVTVLAGEDHSSPVVAINLWVRAGYFDEEDAEIGISHVIEHMFFKGTPDRPRADQIASEIKALGGELNAGTYYDSTNYYVVLPSENYRKGLEIEADALMHPLIDADELKRLIQRRSISTSPSTCPSRSPWPERPTKRNHHDQRRNHSRE